jgi:hypothetical protein
MISSSFVYFCHDASTSDTAKGALTRGYPILDCFFSIYITQPLVLSYSNRKQTNNIVSTFVNVTVYPQHNNNIILKGFNKNNNKKENRLIGRITRLGMRTLPRYGGRNKHFPQCGTREPSGPGPEMKCYIRLCLPGQEISLFNDCHCLSMLV